MLPSDDSSAPILPRPLARYKIKLVEQLNDSPAKLPVQTHEHATADRENGEERLIVPV